MFFALNPNSDKDMKKKNVILVDDETAFLLGFKKTMEGPEFNVDTAETAEEFHERFAEKDYAVVITDIRLTGVMLDEGLDILSYVKEKKPGTMVIIITGFGSPEIKDKAFQRGADLYFEKPVSINVLRRAIAES
jgi:two-component system response regulator PilR (NtrC family)